MMSRKSGFKVLLETENDLQSLYDAGYLVDTKQGKIWFSPSSFIFPTYIYVSLEEKLLSFFKNLSNVSEIPISEILKELGMLNNLEWEIFIDPSYYDMWAVRPKEDKDFNSSRLVHFSTQKDATAFAKVASKGHWAIKKGTNK